MAAKASAIALGFGSSSADSSLGRAAAGEVGAAPDRVRPEDDGGSGLRAYLLAQYKAGHLSAKAVCDLSWHSSNAGAQNVHDLALNPDDHHQADHLRDCIHARSADSFFFADVPMWDKTKEERALVSFPMNLPHECFEWAAGVNPQSHDVHRFSSADLPPQYWTRPVTLAGKKPTPCGVLQRWSPPHEVRFLLELLLGQHADLQKAFNLHSPQVGLLQMWLQEHVHPRQDPEDHRMELQCDGQGGPPEHGPHGRPFPR